MFWVKEKVLTGIIQAVKQAIEFIFRPSWNFKDFWPQVSQRLS